MTMNLSDRCDRDNAQAFVRVEKIRDDGVVLDILFCAHHFNRYEKAVLEQGFVVSEDIRDTINKKPSLSASNV